MSNFCRSKPIISASPSSSEDRWGSTTGSGARVRKVNRCLTCATTRSYTCKFAERRPPLQIHPPPPRTPSLPISLPPRGTGWIARNFRRGEAQESCGWRSWVVEGFTVKEEAARWQEARGGEEVTASRVGRASRRRFGRGVVGVGECDCAHLGRRSSCLLAASSRHYCR